MLKADGQLGLLHFADLLISDLRIEMSARKTICAVSASANAGLEA
jgi:hypothetical protein